MHKKYKRKSHLIFDENKITRLNIPSSYNIRISIKSNTLFPPQLNYQSDRNVFRPSQIELLNLYEIEIGDLRFRFLRCKVESFVYILAI